MDTSVRNLSLWWSPVSDALNPSLLDRTLPFVGDVSGQIHFEGYQVSNQCMALVKSKILLPTYDAPELGYIKETSAEQYVPDVYYKVRISHHSLSLSSCLRAFVSALPLGERFVQQRSDENRPSITVGILDHRCSHRFSFSRRSNPVNLQ